LRLAFGYVTQQRQTQRIASLPLPPARLFKFYK
jgi:hypothetical protein